MLIVVVRLPFSVPLACRRSSPLHVTSISVTLEPVLLALPSVLTCVTDLRQNVSDLN